MKTFVPVHEFGLSTWVAREHIYSIYTNERGWARPFLMTTKLSGVHISQFPCMFLFRHVVENKHYNMW
jgi:hypothetical protein